jgi:hypothetical protein
MLACYVQRRDMDEKVSRSGRQITDPIARYLGKRGIPADKLPSDLLRELTRLLNVPSTALEEMGVPKPDEPKAQNAAGRYYRDMLTFEMYLAAWIAREGMCDRPKPRRKRAKLDHPPKSAGS